MFSRMNQQTEKKEDKTESVLGLGRRTREEIVKWNQMTAPRFKTAGAGSGGWGVGVEEISNIRGLPSGELAKS